MRAEAHRVLRNKPGEPLPVKKDHYFDGDMFTEYVAWREKNPSDDLITELLNVEFEDETGTTRRLTKEELLIFPGGRRRRWVSRPRAGCSDGWAKCWPSTPINARNSSRIVR